jgi:23S rRNA pseudouridine1911/1915/1917 synthase
VIYRDRIAADTTAEAYLQSFSLSQKNIGILFQTGSFRAGSEVCARTAPLAQGTSIAIDLSAFEGPSFVPSQAPIRVLYEDDDLLVVSKPSGQIIYPDNPSGQGTLVNDLLGYYERIGLPGPVRYLHRLDADTTGCFVVAKHLLAHSFLSAKWNHADVRRTYLAVCDGILKPVMGTIDAPIAKDRHRNAYRVGPSGDPAKTDYRVVSQGSRNVLVELTLHTGRTHQIRVHLAHLGHPITGDRLYGGSNVPGPLALHSHRVILPHPRTGQTIDIVDPMPDRYRTLLSR